MPDRDSKLPKSPLARTIQWAGALGALGFLVAIGVWVGTIQQQVTQNVDDISDNEKAIKVNSEKLETAEGRERDRLNTLSKAMARQFNSDKDELWDLKRAMAAVNMRVALYHDQTHAYRPPASISQGASKRPLPRATQRKLAAKQADILVQDVMKEGPAESASMPTF
jgi:hypothetical protein